MSELRTTHGKRELERVNGSDRRPSHYDGSPAKPIHSPALLVAGAAVLALGYLAVRHFGPDLRRYVKMEMM